MRVQLYTDGFVNAWRHSTSSSGQSSSDRILDHIDSEPIQNLHSPCLGCWFYQSTIHIKSIFQGGLDLSNNSAIFVVCLPILLQRDRSLAETKINKIKSNFYISDMHQTQCNSKPCRVMPLRRQAGQIDTIKCHILKK